MNQAINAADCPLQTTFLLYSLHQLRPVGKMALGGLGAKLTEASPEYSNTTTTTVPSEKRDGEIQSPDYDPERQGSKASTGRRMSRIAPPTKAPIEGGDAESGISVGAQIEMEKDNAIRYRTCGWRKV